jgi:Ca2+-binding EF-hand superfamily protein
MFKDYDKNGDGFVSKEEMLLVMKSYGTCPFFLQPCDSELWSGVDMEDAEMAEIIKMSDANGDGKIDYEGAFSDIERTLITLR